MYRIAVIQNEVEMQHSGYVDSVPKYRKQDFDLHEHVFNRFSSVNIGELFTEGENYLLDYDCVIIGTNATSDGDAYNILCNEENKLILEKFISMGKGVLICSQKKLQEDPDADENEYRARKTYFLPEPYEYKVVSRPSKEGSDEGNITVFNQEPNNIQKFLCSFPQIIEDKTIFEHCIKNDFQTHFYRDYIIPLNDSSYFPVLLDEREFARNTLMVARPRKSEKIVISTMALDWAGHYELIENILYYLIIGIPTVAFVDKKDHIAQDFQFLMSEAELSNISYFTYLSVAEVIDSRLRQYHTLYVFSPSYSENEVAEFWESHVKEQGGYTKLFYYKYINNELVLVNFSYFSYIDAQKHEVETWLKSEYKDGLWGNSFWKTYDEILHDVAGVLPLCAEVYQFISQGFVKIQLMVMIHHETADDMMLCVPHNCLAERKGDRSIQHLVSLVDGNYFLVRKQPVALDNAGLLYIVKDISPPAVQILVQDGAIATDAAIGISTLDGIVYDVPFFRCSVIEALVLANPSLVLLLEL